MKVLKFGGTSLGSAQRIKNLKDIILNTKGIKIIVLSAMSGTTNILVSINEYLKERNIKAANEEVNSLELKYNGVIEELFSKKSFIDKSRIMLKFHFSCIRDIINCKNISEEENTILAQGELISTFLLHYYLQEENIENIMLPALDFMRLDKNGEPDYKFIKTNLSKNLNENKKEQIFISQGYICRDNFGNISNLKRGGSDYSAAIIGAVVKAEEIQIWTDIDGIRNNDPRFVEKTEAVRHLSFDEAAELAYFGAKILHPSSIKPAKEFNIPVLLKNTLNPEDIGTEISKTSNNKGILAVAAKDNITAISIKSTNMLLSYGYLRKIFEIFEKWKTPIDMITTSEVAVSLSIDDTSKLDYIIEELKNYACIDININQSIICVVGDFSANNIGLASEVLNSFKDIPLRMISYGGSQHNISILLDENQKINALKSLNNKLLNSN